MRHRCGWNRLTVGNAGYPLEALLGRDHSQREETKLILMWPCVPSSSTVYEKLQKETNFTHNTSQKLSHYHFHFQGSRHPSSCTCRKPEPRKSEIFKWSPASRHLLLGVCQARHGCWWLVPVCSLQAELHHSMYCAKHPPSI